MEIEILKKTTYYAFRLDYAQDSIYAGEILKIIRYFHGKNFQNFEGLSNKSFDSDLNEYFVNRFE